MESPQMESVRFRDMNDVNEKFCVGCKTSKTPLWRSGPAGPKSLCNACGIRYRKKKGTVVSDYTKDKQQPSPSPSSSASSTTGGGGGGGGGVEKKGIISNNLRIKLVALGKDVVLMKRQRSPTKKKMMRQRSENREVEEAAFLLMSLSYGSVSA